MEQYLLPKRPKIALPPPVQIDVDADETQDSEAPGVSEVVEAEPTAPASPELVLAAHNSAVPSEEMATLPLTGASLDVSAFDQEDLLPATLLVTEPTAPVEQQVAQAKSGDVDNRHAPDASAHLGNVSIEGIVVRASTSCRWD